MRWHSTVFMVLGLALGGCAAPEAAPPAASASASVSHPEDAAMTCPAIETEIAEDNKTIASANERTSLISAGAVSVNQPQMSVDSSRMGGNNPSEVNYPGIGTNANSFSTKNDATNESLDAQKARAATAINRANQLIMMGRAKRCFA